jgi:hypothetical protein
MCPRFLFHVWQGICIYPDQKGALPKNTPKFPLLWEKIAEMQLPYHVWSSDQRKNPPPDQESASPAGGRQNLGSELLLRHG